MTDPFIKLPHGVKFAEKWVDWINYKKDIKDSYKSPKSATAKAKQLSKYTEEVAIQMIEQSIADGYKGIFPLKANNGKQVEPKQIYKPSKGQVLSTYKPKEVDQDKVKEFIVNKIRQAYNGEIHLNDAGATYTNRLKPFLSTPEDILELIEEEVTILCNSEPSNRFEEKVEYNHDREVRNRILKYNLNRWRKEGNLVYNKI